MDKGWGVISLLLFFFAGCGRETPPTVADTKTVSGEPQADAVSTFSLVGHAPDGRKKWEIRGQSADLLSETVHLSPVEATAFGETKIDVTADQGQYHKVTQDVHLEKNVVLVTSDGMRLTTDSFQWESEKDTGRTSDWVTVTRPGMKVSGLGGLCYPKVKRVRLEKHVVVTLQGQQGQTVVTCDGPMEVDYGRRKARFWENVLVTDSRGTIRSDRLDVALQPQTDQIEKASFWGHVRIQHGPQTAIAHRANYWQPLGRTSLIGHPRIVMLPDKEG